jgi:hypothetical protein
MKGSKDKEAFELKEVDYSLSVSGGCMIKDHDRIVLTSDIPSEGLKAGDVDTVIHIHREREAYEVEFLTLDGQTVAVITVLASQLRSVNNRDLTHARPMKLAV